jgi:hypothetical protein
LSLDKLIDLSNSQLPPSGSAPGSSDANAPSDGSSPGNTPNYHYGNVSETGPGDATGGANTGTVPGVNNGVGPAPGPGDATGSAPANPAPGDNTSSGQPPPPPPSSPPDDTLSGPGNATSTPSSPPLQGHLVQNTPAASTPPLQGHVIQNVPPVLQRETPTEAPTPPLQGRVVQDNPPTLQNQTPTAAPAPPPLTGIVEKSPAPAPPPASPPPSPSPSPSPSPPLIFGLPGSGTPASPSGPAAPPNRVLAGPIPGLAVAGSGYQLTLPNGKTLDVIQPSSADDAEKQEYSGQVAGFSDGLSAGQKAAKDKQPDKLTQAMKKAFEILKLGAGVQTLEALEKGKALQDSLAEYQKWSDFLRYYQHLVDTSQVPSDPYVFAYIQGELAAIIINASTGVVGGRSTK